MQVMGFESAWKEVLRADSSNVPQVYSMIKFNITKLENIDKKLLVSSLAPLVHVPRGAGLAKLSAVGSRPSKVARFVSVWNASRNASPHRFVPAGGAIAVSKRLALPFRLE